MTAGPETPVAAHLTVADVLADPIVQRGRPEVIAGERSLTRRVRWIHVSEYLDIASVLRGGELLLTTGLGLPAKGAEQRSWIEAVARRGVAGVLVELGSAVHQVSRDLRQAAAEHELPLVVLHRQIPFVAVTEALHPRIAGVEVEELRRSRAIAERLMRSALEGGGVAEVLAVLSSELGGPAWVAREHGEIVFRTPGVDDAVARTASAVSAAIRLGSDATWATLLLQPSAAVPAAVAEAVADDAAAVIALLLMRAHERDALALSHASAFLTELAGGYGAGDELGMRERAGALGLSLSPANLMPIVIIPAEHRAAPSIGDWARIARRAIRRLDALGIPAIVGRSPDHPVLMVVCDLRHANERPTAAQAVARSIEDERLVERSARRVRVCVGAPTSSWAELRVALRATLSAAPAARFRPEQAWHDVSVPTVEDLLWALRDQDVAHTFVERRLGPIVDLDARRGTRLLETLEAFCEHGGRKTETARALSVERQSLYKRLRRLEQELGVDLDDQQTRTTLHLAIVAKRFFERTKSSADGRRREHA